MVVYTCQLIIRLRVIRTRLPACPGMTGRCGNTAQDPFSAQSGGFLRTQPAAALRTADETLHSEPARTSLLSCPGAPGPRHFVRSSPSMMNSVDNMSRPTSYLRLFQEIPTLGPRLLPAPLLPQLSFPCCIHCLWAQRGWYREGMKGNHRYKTLIIPKEIKQETREVISNENKKFRINSAFRLWMGQVLH